MKNMLIFLCCSFSLCVSANPKVQFVENLKAGEKQTIVTFGTSLTAVGAWVGQLQVVLNQQFPGQAKVVNGAQGGANSSWGKGALDKKVLAHKPDTVFIEFAINDAVERRKVSVEKAQENLEDMIRRILKQNPQCEIILMTMNVPVGHTGVQRPKIADYYQMYRDEAKRHGFKLIDHNASWKKVLEESPELYIQYMPDCIHPLYDGALKVITPKMIQSLGLEPGNAAKSEETPCFNYIYRTMDRLIEANWQVTREEYELFWANHFKMQDANKDGLIQSNEYPEEGIFKHFDANGDQAVSLEEYQKVYAYNFNKYDKKNTGVIMIKKDKFNY
ncbi:GDSL-type esterase/lipase family protein [Lentisphaera profundi]|uniref:GDSL-type esterase/lipase family protein n=1 Tax=Lentisphaera profundi TaxID=1658616 RepID=A0ABY7VTF8_9BACT|nr:GDSL-type esterase/lipase family protein [Lentisphaera profundi]WDE97201.1 GDSL-type esterase/lipase family protein [Lentisphaera profundi]